MSTRALIFDVDLMRPGCVLLQAAGGGDRDLLMALFPSETWLDAPTDGMGRYVGTDEEWEQIARVTQRSEPDPRWTRKRAGLRHSLAAHTR